MFRNSRYINSRPQKHGRYIDPDKFVNVAEAMPEPEKFISQHSFSDFGLVDSLYQNIVRRGFTTPTPVQDGAIKPAMAGRDLIGLANTGTGKTAAFVLPIIHRLKSDSQTQTVLIIAPTRELAIQIDEEFRAFARGLGMYSALILGGVSAGPQIQALSRRPQVVIGTPGRLKDLFNQGALKLDRVGILVLDEVDRMLDMGFIRDIRFLVDQLPQKRQSLCFSATLPPEISQLLEPMLNNPVTVSVRTSENGNHIQQDIIRASSKEMKLELLQNLLRQPGFEKVLIFGETKWSVQRLADSLSKQGFAAEAIHGNKSQVQRQRALKAFKEGRVAILVATDVASRGLDIPAVSHVINFDQPKTYEDYIHRIGRTARAGHQGQALTFVS